MSNSAEALAIALNVSGNDLAMLVSSIFNDISNDGLGDFYVNAATECERIEIIRAYTQVANKKFIDFYVAWSVNYEKKAAFNEAVIRLIKRSNNEKH